MPLGMNRMPPPTDLVDGLLDGVGIVRDAVAPDGEVFRRQVDRRRVVQTHGVDRGCVEKPRGQKNARDEGPGQHGFATHVMPSQSLSEWRYSSIEGTITARPGGSCKRRGQRRVVLFVLFVPFVLQD